MNTQQCGGISDTIECSIQNSRANYIEKELTTTHNFCNFIHSMNTVSYFR